MGNQQQQSLKPPSSQKNQQMGFKDKLFKSLSKSIKKEKPLKQQSLSAKHFFELPTKVLVIISQFLTTTEFLNLRLCSQLSNEKIGKMVNPYIHFVIKAIKFEDSYVPEDFTILLGLLIDRANPKWRGMALSVFQIKKQLHHLKQNGYPELETSIKQAMAKQTLQLPELMQETFEAGLTTWAQKRILKQKYKMQNSTDQQSSQLVAQLKHFNNDELLNQMRQGKGFINFYCPTLSIIIHTIIFTIKTYVSAIRLIIEDLDLNCQMQTYVTQWKKFQIIVAALSDTIGPFVTQYDKAFGRNSIFEIEMFSIWKAEIFNKKSYIAETLIQIFNSKIHEMRTQQLPTVNFGQLQTFFNSMTDLQIDISNITEIGHHRFEFSSQCKDVLLQIQLHSEELYEKFENIQCIDDDISKLKQVFPEWIADNFFSNIADDFKFRKISPILESELQQILEDPQIQLLDETHQETPLSFPQQLEKQYRDNLDSLLMDELQLLTSKNKQLMGYSNKIQLNESQELDDNMLSSTISTISTISSSIATLKSSMNFQKSKCQVKSSNFILKSLRQKNSKVLIELENQIKEREKRTLERETRERHISLKQKNRHQQQEFTTITFPSFSPGVSLAQMITSISK